MNPPAITKSFIVLTLPVLMFLVELDTARAETGRYPDTPPPLSTENNLEKADNTFEDEELKDPIYNSATRSDNHAQHHPLEQLHIGIPHLNINDYLAFVGKRDVREITDYSGVHSHREVVEIVLLQQALFLGGFKGKISIIVTGYYNRRIRELIKGTMLVSGNTLWLEDLSKIKDKVYISDALVRIGEFEAGLYTSKSNVKAQSAKSLSDVQNLVGVASRQWKRDWALLEEMGLKKRVHAIDYDSMLKIISNGRADFILAPFEPNWNLEMVREGAKGEVFVPIPGLKVFFNASRHYAVSKAHPNGQYTIELLQAGIKVLRQQGRIVQAYTQSGFFNPQTRDWKVINKHPSALNSNRATPP